MKLLILFLMISLNSLSNFENLKTIPVLVTINGQKSDSVLIEIGEQKFWTDKNGLANLEVEVGVYEAWVSKGEHIQGFDIIINENTSFVLLEIED